MTEQNQDNDIYAVYLDGFREYTEVKGKDAAKRVSQEIRLYDRMVNRSNRSVHVKRKK